MKKLILANNGFFDIRLDFSKGPGGRWLMGWISTGPAMGNKGLGFDLMIRPPKLPVKLPILYLRGIRNGSCVNTFRIKIGKLEAL